MLSPVWTACLVIIQQITHLSCRSVRVEDTQELSAGRVAQLLLPLLGSDVEKDDILKVIPYKNAYKRNGNIKQDNKLLTISQPKFKDPSIAIIVSSPKQRGDKKDDQNSPKQLRLRSEGDNKKAVQESIVNGQEFKSLPNYVQKLKSQSEESQHTVTGKWADFNAERHKQIKSQIKNATEEGKHAQENTISSRSIQNSKVEQHSVRSHTSVKKTVDKISHKINWDDKRLDHGLNVKESSMHKDKKQDNEPKGVTTRKPTEVSFHKHRHTDHSNHISKVGVKPNSGKKQQNPKEDKSSRVGHKQSKVRIPESLHAKAVPQANKHKNVTIIQPLKENIQKKVTRNDSKLSKDVTSKVVKDLKLGKVESKEETSEEKISEEETSEKETSEEGTLEEGTSEEGTSEEGTSEEGTSEKGTSEGGTSEKGTSEEVSSEESSSENDTSDESKSEDDTSEESTSDHSSSEELSPEDESSEELQSGDLELMEGLSLEERTSQKQTSKEVASENQSSEEFPSQEETSEKVTPKDPSSEDLSLDYLSSEDPTSENITPEVESSERSSENVASIELSSAEVASEDVSSKNNKQVMSDNLTPEDLMTEEIASDKLTSDKDQTSEESLSTNITSDNANSDEIMDPTSEKLSAEDVTTNNSLEDDRSRLKLSEETTTENFTKNISTSNSASEESVTEKVSPENRNWVNVTANDVGPNNELSDNLFSHDEFSENVSSDELSLENLSSENKTPDDVSVENDTPTDVEEDKTLNVPLENPINEDEKPEAIASEYLSVENVTEKDETTEDSISIASIITEVASEETNMTSWAASSEDTSSQEESPEDLTSKSESENSQYQPGYDDIISQEKSFSDETLDDIFSQEASTNSENSLDVKTDISKENLSSVFVYNNTEVNDVTSREVSSKNVTVENGIFSSHPKDPKHKKEHKKKPDRNRNKPDNKSHKSADKKCHNNSTDDLKKLEQLSRFVGVLKHYIKDRVQIETEKAKGSTFNLSFLFHKR
ncbi:enolase-phosphatase E1-like [Pectinophora gossypiella]|uniref:enolase-phosphatase E1-like n=1 Tax=Pectinophora gossypiella TaxID=13191 RepID=UPI00214E2306|nr:enolase-phosphatase E1-like [Pectinophora gossypiella]